MGKCRLWTLFVVVGTLSLFHGGVPAFMFFALLFSCSLCCARKRERCGGCCSRRRRCHAKKMTMEKLTATAEMATARDGDHQQRGVCRGRAREERERTHSPQFGRYR